MRVTGGVLLNRKVICPPGVIRPAMDRMRESLFSILLSKNALDNISFLDLFGGSGIMSIEASSRGAKSVDVIEKDYGKKNTILQNLKLLDEIGTSYHLYIKDAFKFLKETKNTYDIIYADPPFPLKNKESILDILENNRTILKQNGYFIIHIPEEDLKLWSEKTEHFSRIDVRCYGRSILLFYT